MFYRKRDSGEIFGLKETIWLNSVKNFFELFRGQVDLSDDPANERSGNDPSRMIRKCSCPPVWMPVKNVAALLPH